MNLLSREDVGTLWQAVRGRAVRSDCAPARAAECGRPLGEMQLAYHPCCVRQETRATKCDEIDESGHRVGKGLIKIGLGFGRSQYHDCALIASYPPLQ